MTLTASARITRSGMLTLALALSSTLVAPIAANAQTPDFDGVVAEARDRAQAIVDEANLASEEGSSTMAVEQQLMGPVAEYLPVIVVEFSEYAALLESLDAPADRAEDVATQVASLREIANELDATAQAAAVGDEAAAVEGYRAAANLLETLAADLSPDYFDLAFLTPVRERYDSFKGLTDEELTFLAGAEDASLEFQRRNDAAFRAIGGTYPSPEAMMQALYDAGAGEAFPAVEAKARALTPPQRFADEHEHWLAVLAEQSRLDRLIGEAARDGDAVEFMTINLRLGNATRSIGAYEIDPEFDAAFGRSIQPGGPLSMKLDTATPAGRDPYGVALFLALRNYSNSDVSANAADAFFFPGVTREMQMEAVANIAEEFEAGWVRLEDDIRSLEPSAEFADDHALILGYLDEHGTQFRGLLEAAQAGDGGATQAALDSMRASYCGTASALSGDVVPATSVYFDASLDICR